MDTIARRTGVSRAAMFAALKGRIPSRWTLEVMVDAWGGDRQEWLAKRRHYEAEVERSRNGTSSEVRAPAQPRDLMPIETAARVLEDWTERTQKLRAGLQRREAIIIKTRGIAEAENSLYSGEYLDWEALSALLDALGEDPTGWREDWNTANEALRTQQAFKAFSRRDDVPVTW
ncbi:hypothetical protein [Nocardia fluminea]|uniref:hypothetical protein n=1 Tax=Nocardia fluminea TaxID=134984 RepID=UPI0037930821